MKTVTRPFVLVISAPSGAGKTSLARALVDRDDRLTFSVSATTRLPRQHERQGVDYVFVSHTEFERMRDAGELAEWAEVHGRSYGTPRAELEAALDEGRIPVLDIDVQGARQIRTAFPDAVLVFILPPTADELFRRLDRRGSEDPAERRRRLDGARKELPALHDFDYFVVNDDFEEAVGALEAIVAAEAQRVTRIEAPATALQGLEADLIEMLERRP